MSVLAPSPTCQMASFAACRNAFGCTLLPKLVANVRGPAPRNCVQITSLLLQLRPASGRGSSCSIPAAVAAWQPAVRCSSSRSSHAAAEQPPSPSEKKRILFCGTPDVAALVLKRLLEAAAQPDATFEIAGVLTQPPRPTGRGNRKVPQPSPVQQLAQEAGLPAQAIFFPERPGDKAFLAAMKELAPDLCVTAAYGNYLPSAFLAIPPLGTLNIHPSLLPRYRGAAPVQRSLEDGVAVSGVTVLYTVKAMDAGPILAQQKVPVDPDIQAPELLNQLFELGCELLVKNLEVVWAGMSDAVAQPQDESAATHAAKLTREEAVLDFSQPALVCHNKVRGFAGWPSTFATFTQQAADDAADGGLATQLELKVVRTKVVNPSAWRGASEREVTATKDGLFIRCGDGSVLQVLEVQAPGKRAMAAKDFVNGLKGRTLLWQPVQQAAPVAA